LERIDSILAFTEPMLGVDRSQDERTYIRKQPGGWLFITRDPVDTIYFPLEHPLQGRDRYHWVDGSEGMRRGYLTEEARNP
jgi:hypothetical protein